MTGSGSRRVAVRFAAMLAITMALAACSTAPKVSPDETRRQALYQQRLVVLESRDHWALKARLAINSADDGGSGVLNWSRQADSQRMDFHGALGRGAWRLQADRDGVMLTQSDGETHRADTIDELVREQLGHDVPVSALAWWIRGLAAPGDPKQISLDEEGRPDALVQQGWNIEFERYRAFGDQQLPQRITARQGEWTVKLAVRNWSLPKAAPAD